MKLELQHLAGYLPYGLKGNYNISDVVPEYKYELRGNELRTDNVDFFLQYAKPILRPLSDLTKEIEVNGEKFVPILELYKMNFTSGMWEQIRYYAGLRAGIISRGGNGYPTLGTEIGIDYVIGSLVLGIRMTRDKRSDFEFYGEPSEMRNSGFIKIGVKL